MDTRQLPQESFLRTARLYILTRSRRILFAMAIGVITITAATTYCIVKYRKKRRKELAREKQSGKGLIEGESTDTTPPSDGEDRKSALSASAKSEASSQSVKSVESSYSERVVESSQKEEEKKPIHDNLVRTRYVELTDSEKETLGNSGKGLEAKDILPSISLEERSERGAASLPREEVASPSSISVSMPRMRVPRIPRKPASERIQSSSSDEPPHRTGSEEKMKAESQEKDRGSRGSKDKGTSKEKSGSKQSSRQKPKSSRKTSKKGSTRKTSARSTSSWTFKNVGKKRPKDSKHHKKKKKKSKEKGTKRKGSKRKSKGKRKQSKHVTSQ
ncbi:hypothetical protein ANCCAN_01735 [Ancylostoma caninum]|uniref:Uncharacterized protein n=1 Tax=Ancylostoma caninum TaxID=29170 RepID=A0A368H6T7_ANCCA|nr:hypothetical protein ANCCAN_01735 [Ancylostoma caninum]